MEKPTHFALTIQERKVLHDYLINRPIKEIELIQPLLEIVEKARPILIKEEPKAEAAAEAFKNEQE